MTETFIHDTAIIKNSNIGKLKAYRNVVISDSYLDDCCSVGDDTTIERCKIENNVTINRRSYINDSEIGRYSYSGINTTINWAKIGRFCSMARNIDIGGFDHDYKKVTTMPYFRFNQMKSGGGKLHGSLSSKEHCEIGNDVWIAAGAIILHDIRIGTGAVIGAGAVVTHDIPPYAIAVGAPAKVIGFRCEEKCIQKLLEIEWWNWPKDVLLDNMESFMDKDISDETIEWMESIADQVRKRIYGKNSSHSPIPPVL